MNAASKMPRPSISAIIITLDAAAHIESCIRSLSFCDEIIVVDSGSTDGTQGLAEALGAKVSYNAWPGFGPQKQHALSLATSPWIFSIDADEQVPEELAGEIAAAVSSIERRDTSMVGHPRDSYSRREAAISSATRLRST